jgi:hypothetical protein
VGDIVIDVEVGALPAEIPWRHMFVLGCLAGIGLTMPFFWLIRLFRLVALAKNFLTVSSLDSTINSEAVRPAIPRNRNHHGPGDVSMLANIWIDGACRQEASFGTLDSPTVLVDHSRADFNAALIVD